VLLVAGGICALFALVPGFPAVTFLVMAVALAGGGALLTPMLRQRMAKASGPAFEAVVKRKEAAPGVMATALPAPHPAVPLLLELPPRALGADQGATLTRSLESVLDHFQLSLGLALPRISIHARAEGGDGWQLHAFEVPVARGELPEGDIPAGLATAVREALRRHTVLFLGIQEASALLTRASIDYPEAVKEVLRVIPMQRLADIFRRLVEEEVSVRHTRDMLEALAEAGQREKDVFTLAEFARIALKRHISHRYAPDGVLRATLLLPDLEELLRQALRTNGGAQQLAIDPQVARQVIDLIRQSVETHGVAAVVTTVDLRRHVRKLIELDCFDVPVLSYHELMPSLRLDVADRVGAPATALLEAA